MSQAELVHKNNLKDKSEGKNCETYPKNYMLIVKPVALGTCDKELQSISE